MRISDFYLKRDGDTVVVYKITFNDKKKEEVLKPTAYVRGVLEAMLWVQRKMTVAQLDEVGGVNELITLLEKQEKELHGIIKKNCRECLNE